MKIKVSLLKNGDYNCLVSRLVCPFLLCLQTSNLEEDIESTLECHRVVEEEKTLLTVNSTQHHYSILPRLLCIVPSIVDIRMGCMPFRLNTKCEICNLTKH